jgi:hypothetical protein
MTSYVIMYLFITGTKVLSFATKLLQQEARPQGDLEQIMVVHFTEKKKKKTTLPNAKATTRIA